MTEADPNEVVASLDKLRKDTQKSKELEDVKKRLDEAHKEIEGSKVNLKQSRQIKTSKGNMQIL